MHGVRVLGAIWSATTILPGFFGLPIECLGRDVATIAFESFVGCGANEHQPSPASSVRLASTTTVFGVVRFIAWPDFMALPSDAVATTARLCALVSRRPTQASLIPLILEVPKDAVFNVLEQLRRAGSVEWSEAFASCVSEPVARPVDPVDADASASSSFLVKLWRHLRDHK